MSIGYLAESVGKTITSRFTRSYRQTEFIREGIIRLEGGLYALVIVPLLAFLPASFAYGVACLRGKWRYYLETSKRQSILRGLEGILGEQLSPTERVRVAHDYFCLRSCEAVDVMRLVGSGSALAQLVEIRGLEHIQAALAAGKGALLCSAHFGSFTSCFSLIGAYGFPITVIGRWPSTTDRSWSPIERFFWQFLVQKPLVHHCHRPNIEPLGGQLGTAVQIATILRNNELIGVCLDPAVLAADRERAVAVDFLNGKARLLTGVITTAELTGAPVLMTFLRRSADWRHQILEISPPMSLDGDMVEAFGRCLAIVDAAIRQNPAHWFFWEEFQLFWLGLLPTEPENAPMQFSNHSRPCR